MAYGYTLHSIRRGGKDLPIGAVVEFSEKDHADMLRLGAIRDPSDNELALFGLANPAAGEPEGSDGDEGDKKLAKGKRGKAKPDAAAGEGTGETGGEAGGTPAAGEGSGASAASESGDAALV